MEVRNLGITVRLQTEKMIRLALKHQRNHAEVVFQKNLLIVIVDVIVELVMIPLKTLGLLLPLLAS